MVIKWKSISALCAHAYNYSSSIKLVGILPVPSDGNMRKQKCRGARIRMLVAIVVSAFSYSATNSCSAEDVGSRVAVSAKTTPQRVKVAAVQISGYDKTDLPRDDYQPAKELVRYIKRAGSEGAQLIVFPEYILGHITVPGAQTRIISQAAKENGVHVIVGCWEDEKPGSYHNTIMIFGPDGAILGKYRKTHAAVDTFEGSPPYAKPPQNKTRRWFLENDPEWKMTKGDGFPVFDLGFAKVGIMTCYDGWFPETPRILSLQGAELIVWVNGRRGRVEDFICKSIMFQSHVAMITTNQAYGSGTLIADNHHQFLEVAKDRTECYISATIDLHKVRNRRARSRNFQQRRPEIYAPLTSNRLLDSSSLPPKGNVP